MTSTPPGRTIVAWIPKRASSGSPLNGTSDSGWMRSVRASCESTCDDPQNAHFVALTPSGNSTAAHLHFEVQHNGDVVEEEYDPAVFWASPLPYQATVRSVLDSGVSSSFTVTGTNSGAPSYTCTWSSGGNPPLVCA